MNRARVWLLAAVVGLAFADSSVVVLGLPSVLREFDASVTGVSWVITSYNLTVTIVAAGMAAGLGRQRARPLLAAGLVVFMAASAGCALAPDLAWLIVLRCIQGVGGALLLGASLPLLAASAGTARRGAAIWATAGAIGAAVGPALGGVLTEIWDWRAIFAVQAPLAAAALAAVFGSAAAIDATTEGEPTPHGLRRTANLALALVSGATVGALFLVVTLLVEVFGLEPIGAAAVVTALPLATVAAGRLTEHAPRGAASAAGGILLAGGLAGLAFLPSDATGWVVAGLVLCGAGVGLAVPTLTRLALGRPGREGEDASWTTAARHAGLVLALILVAPLLSHSLDEQETAAERAGTALVLDAPLPFQIKVPLAVSLAEQLKATPTAEIPDVGPAFARVGDGASSEDQSALATLQRELVDAVEAVVARAFRPSFLLCALLALLGAAALAPLAVRELR